MSELIKDRYEAFQERFGTAGVVIGVIALIVALTGTAFAASGLNPKQKKEVKAIAKSFQGTGPAGAAGAAGPAGAKGDNGANGTNGTPGVPGADGKTVLNGTTVPAAGLGNNGDFYIRTSTDEIYGPKTAGAWGSGTELIGEEGQPGIQGPPGPEGVCSTSSCHLPANVTETGAWAFTVTGAGTPPLQAESFNVPLSAPLSGEGCPLAETCHVHTFRNSNFTDFDGAGPLTAGCTGSITAPTAPSGHLCLYGFDEEGEMNLLAILDPTGLFGGASKNGFVIRTSFAGFDIAGGTWAVTG